MAPKILITGGAGFIGSHIADELLEHGYDVRALDVLASQVHGEHAALARPAYLSPDVELFAGDIRDPEAVSRALEGVDSVLHLASVVGLGQSMYEIAHFTSVNILGTAVLLEALVRTPVERLVVASCLSVYGEGLYRIAGGALTEGRERPHFRLKDRDWDVRDTSGALMSAVATPESKRLAPASVYAISKCDQERLCMTVGAAYGVPTVVLRLGEVYGARQAVANPHAGMLSVCAARYLNDEPPLIFEDGEQQRDFVNVRDVATAFRLALESPRAEGGIFNIASGCGQTVRNIARDLGAALGKWAIEPRITGEYRIGDIRHCFADISLARSVLGYEPHVTLCDGLRELATSLAGQTVADHSEEASEELALRGLMV